MFYFEKWSSELGVEDAKGKRLVYDEGRICCNDRRLQVVYMAEKFYERARQGVGDFGTIQ